MPLPTTPGRDFVIGRYTLVVHDRLSGRYAHEDFASLDDLARATFHAIAGCVDGYGFRRYDLPLAYSPRGKLLDVHALEAHGRRLYNSRTGYWTRLYPGYVRRRGPVHGIRKWRGGGHYFRRIHTTPERRQAALVVYEDGEVAARPARNLRNLPNSWDDYARCVERSWKSQHKGRKAWDR